VLHILTVFGLDVIAIGNYPLYPIAMITTGLSKHSSFSFHRLYSTRNNNTIQDTLIHCVIYRKKNIPLFYTDIFLENKLVVWKSSRNILFQMNGTCTCKPGYTGTNCEVSIDECSTPAICTANSTCVELDELFNCVCDMGYIQTNDGNCTRRYYSCLYFNNTSTCM